MNKKWRMSIKRRWREKEREGEVVKKKKKKRKGGRDKKSTIIIIFYASLIE